jgi:hypothetical protein
MALTRITSGVISANVVTSEKLQNSIIQARHIQAGALTTDLFEESGNAAAVEIRVNANVDIVQDNVVATQANVDILQDNVNTTTSNIATLTTSVNTIYANVNTVQDNVALNVLNIDQVQSNVDIISSNLNGVIDGTVPFTGPVTMQDTLTVEGNLIVVGAQVDLGIVSATVNDPTLLLAANTPVDVGLPTDSGILINRGANANVFFGFAQYGDHIDFIFTDAPGDNTVHYPIAYVDVHANSFGSDATHSEEFVGFGHADQSNTGMYFLEDGVVRFAANATQSTNVTSRGLEANAVYSQGVELRANDYVTYVRLNANVDAVSSNTESVSVNLQARYTQITANLNTTNDNVTAVIANTDLVQDNVAALTGGATILVPFTNVNTALGTSNVFFIGQDCANDSNVLVVTLDGIRQHSTLDWVGNYSNDTVQFVDASIPSGTIVSITSLAP